MSVTQQETMEVWELTIPGRVSISVDNEYGRPRTITARGEGQRLRVTPTQRRIAQEQIREAANDPFRNGMMIKVNRDVLDAEARERAAAEDRSFEPDPRDAASDDELTDEMLAQMFLFSVDEGTFGSALDALSEVNVRRLQRLAAVHDAKASQVAAINEYIQEHYSIGGTTPTYEEMQQRPESAV